MITATCVTTSPEILDTSCEALLGNDVHSGMSRLRASLHRLRAHLPREDWIAFGEQARSHPLHDLLLESPFTQRAYAKPRGYAGDAILMDLIYGTPPGTDLSPLGGMLYGYEFDSPCFKSVRIRRAILAREIDDVAASQSDARVLAVACGHLRELEWSRAARNGAVTVAALDQDRDSLDVVSERYSGVGVTTVAASVGDLLRRNVGFSGLDLAYAAGLYDYLDHDIARALTATLFRMLAPGGRLLIANFTPATYDAAFMETFMDWRLVYRTAEEVRALAATIPRAAVSRIDQFVDDNAHIAYLRVVKR